MLLRALLDLVKGEGTLSQVGCGKAASLGVVEGFASFSVDFYGFSFRNRGFRPEIRTLSWCFRGVEGSKSHLLAQRWARTCPR